ncbi:MAG: FAD-dependent oxidoreductase [Bacillota bacterium]|nr:FAD-dependent oxidoreductase [Bacillota bacterium]MDI3317394.1 FAD-dependent oxidoreductase [Bacillota bacterium]
MAIRFDAVIVGGGPAGLSAALVLAQAGVKVAVIERGDYAGAKNMFGGVIYHEPTDWVVPGFASEAPLERRIGHHEYWFLDERSALKIAYEDAAWREKPNAWSVMRAKFDAWFAGKVEKAGAQVITQTTVVDLLRDGRTIRGVVTSRPEGEVEAPLVLIAQGVNALLVEKAGLGRDWRADEVVLGVKEVIQLPKGAIEERFGLTEGEGTAVEMLGGEATAGLMGSAFLYTNSDTVSIGTAVLLSHLREQGENPNRLLERIKAHPSVAPLLKGGEMREYSAHLIPEGGYRAMPRLYGNGVLVAGDSAAMVNAVTMEGTDLAMVSGKLAGETMLEALEKGDFTERTLSRYRDRLEDSFVFRDLKQFSRVGTFFADNRQYFDFYPRLANGVARQLFTVDLRPKAEHVRGLLDQIRGRRSLWRIGMDLVRGWRALA